MLHQNSTLSLSDGVGARARASLQIRQFQFVSANALAKCRFSDRDVPPIKRSMKVNQKLTPERLMQFGSAYAPPFIIGAAVSNKVFDTLASGAKTVGQLSKETGTSPRGLRAIMNALVGLELLRKSGDKYSLTPESEAFLVSNKPGTLAGFFPMNMKRLIPPWLKLDDIVRTGEPAEARTEEHPGTEFFTELVG